TETYDIYRRSAYIVDQRWSVRQNAARQKHVDQGISFNFYVPNTIRASILLDLHLQAWKEGLKTTYYVRSTANDIEGCEWCHSRERSLSTFPIVVTQKKSLKSLKGN